MLVKEAPAPSAFLAVSRDLLARGYQVRFQAAGSSMFPAIRHLDMLTICGTDASGIRTGEVVLYCLGEGVIAHRVIGIEHNADGRVCRIRLRGDWSDGPDPPVDPRQILGRVVAVERDGREVAFSGRWVTLRHGVRRRLSRLKRILLGVSPPPDTRFEP